MPYVYTDDFDGVDGAAPANLVLSEVNGTGGTQALLANQYRMLTTATNFNTQRAILPAAIFNVADGYATFGFNGVTTLGQVQVIMRASGTWDGSENDSPTTGYKFLLNMVGNTIALYRRTGGTTTQVGTDQFFAWAANTNYFGRFNLSGADLKVKVWIQTDPEPGSWTYEVTDSSPILSAGQLMLNFRNVSSAVRDLRWTVLAVGIPSVEAAAGVATGVGVADSVTVDVPRTIIKVSTGVGVATGVGSAPFDGTNSASVTLEIYGALTASGVANNATVSTGGNTSAAATVAASTGTANPATIGLGSSPAATTATGVGAANPATVPSTGTVSALAQVATGAGASSGVSYLLDENGDQVLDENSQPIEDGYGLTISLAPSPSGAASVGAANAPSRSVSTQVGAAASVGSAPQPSITVGAGSVSANVNAVAASASGAAWGAAITLATQQVGVASSTGTAIAPAVTTDSTTNVNPFVAVAVAVMFPPSVPAVIAPVIAPAVGTGSALAPNVMTASGSSDTNVNATIATSAGTSNSVAALVSPATTSAASTGTAETPQTTSPVQAAPATSTGAAYDVGVTRANANPVGIGQAYDAQVNIDSANFIAAAPIPISGSAADANISIYVYPAGITVTGVASPANQSTDIPGQLITLRDTGHTVTVKER